jgi:transglutaminase-like putative cysteine protease
MDLRVGSWTEYLGEDGTVDRSHPAVVDTFQRLADGHDAQDAFARAAFEYVRDEVAHSCDVRDRRVTISASDVAREGVGLCYAKSHLLVALLRSARIPAGFCYQRLADGDGHVIHGLTAVRLGGTWHRLDPRGNKPGIHAQFSLGEERLAWRVRPEIGEIDYPTVLPAPHPTVLRALRGSLDVLELAAGGLPTDL